MLSVPLPSRFSGNLDLQITANHCKSDLLFICKNKCKSLQIMICRLQIRLPINALFVKVCKSSANHDLQLDLQLANHDLQSANHPKALFEGRDAYTTRTKNRSRIDVLAHVAPKRLLDDNIDSNMFISRAYGCSGGSFRIPKGFPRVSRKRSLGFPRDFQEVLKVLPGGFLRDPLGGGSKRVPL